MNLRVIGETIAVITLLTSVILFLYGIRQMKKTQETVMEIIPDMDNFFQIGEDGVVSMDERIVKVLDYGCSRVAQSLRMAFLQQLGANAKIEQGLKGAIAADVIDNKMPILNLVGEFAGINVKKYVSKNPGAIGQLLSMVPPQWLGALQGNFMKNNGEPNQVSGQTQGGVM